MLRIKISGIFLFISLILFSQQTSYLLFSDNSFVNKDILMVSNDTCLNSLFSKLDRVKNAPEELKINFLHIGDSHIQGDFLTKEIRNSLQQQFGNAGRGLIFPHRLAGIFEVKDIHSVSTTAWSKSTIFGMKKLFEAGVAGTSVSAPAGNFSIGLNVNNYWGQDVSFDRVKILCRNESGIKTATIQDSAKKFTKNFKIDKKNLYDIKLGNNLTGFNFQSDGPLIIDGFILENSQSGILYNVTGVSGAHFIDYNRSPVFFSQISLLQPDVILISLGTNEGVNPRVTKAEMIPVIEKLISEIRKNNPQTPVVLITPFDNFFRVKYLNNNLLTISESIVEVAKRNHLAYIDAYKITGGYGSARQWKKLNMLRIDGIHYTQEGYSLQGKIIYQALINSYKKYAGHRSR